jgi:transposase
MAFLVYGLTAGFILSDSAASEAYGAHGEWLREFLVAVKRAAQEGPAWPTYPQVVQRHIEAIQYHAEEMIAARETADRTRAEEQMSRSLHFFVVVLINDTLPIRMSHHLFKL